MSDIKRCPHFELEVGGATINPETVHEIARFTIFWGKFEFYNKCNKYSMPEDLPKIARKIETINDEVFKNLAMVLDAQAAGKGYSVPGYITDALKARDDEYALYIERFMNSECSNKNDWILGAVCVIDCVRNNLFNGEKDVSILDKQIYLFRAVNNVLEELIQNQS